VKQSLPKRQSCPTKVEQRSIRNLAFLHHERGVARQKLRDDVEPIHVERIEAAARKSRLH
jgi:hypothetical protein